MAFQSWNYFIIVQPNSELLNLSVAGGAVVLPHLNLLQPNQENPRVCFLGGGC